MAPALLASAFADPRARLLVLDGLDPVEGGDGELAWASLPPGRGAEDFILLGMDEDGPAFAEINPDIPHGAVFAPQVWEMASLLRTDALALYGCARSLLDWHKRHGFCANLCKAPHTNTSCWARIFNECEANQFPPWVPPNTTP